MQRRLRITAGIIFSFIGALGVAAFPYVGSDAILFFYPKSQVTTGIGDTFLSSSLHFVIWLVLIGFFLILVLVGIRKSRVPKNSCRPYFTIFAASLAMVPLAAYTWVGSEILNGQHLSVGLYLSVLNGDLPHVRRLLFIGADPNRVGLKGNNPNQYTPLMIAAGKCDEKAVALLIESGAKIDARDINGQTAKQLAKRASCMEVVGELKAAHRQHE